MGGGRHGPSALHSERAPVPMLGKTFLLIDINSILFKIFSCIRG